MEYEQRNCVTNPNNHWESCTLEKDGTLSFADGDIRQGGVFLSKTFYLHFKKPYWTQVGIVIDSIKMHRPAYHKLIIEMLKKNNVLQKIQNNINESYNWQIVPFSEREKDKAIIKLYQEHFEEIKNLMKDRTVCNNKTDFTEQMRDLLLRAINIANSLEIQIKNAEHNEWFKEVKV